MRILIATSFSLPGPGGVWTYVSWLEKGLKQLGHEVNILAPHPASPEYYLLNRGTRVDKDSIKRLVYPKIREFTGRNLKYAQRSLIQFLEVERYCLEIAALYFGIGHYDVIHTQDVIASLALSRVKPAETPLFATIHSSLSAELLIHRQLNHEDALQLNYVKMLERAGIMASAVTITPSKWLKNLLRRGLEVEDTHLAAIPSGINIPDFESDMQKSSDLLFAADKKHIVCPARLDPIKGHHDLLNALWKLNQDRQDWVCWLLGDGPLLAELKTRSKQLGLEAQVIFAGPRPDVPALLKQADVVTLASHQENLPFAVMEAQLAGKPVVVTDTGGIPEMVSHEKTGLISPVHNSDALYENLKRILSDETLRKQIVQHARQFADKAWDLKTMMERIMKLYNNVLSYSQKTNGPMELIPDRSSRQAENSRSNFILAKAYEQLFSPELAPSPILVERTVWDRVMQHAHKTYQIPDTLFSRTLENASKEGW